MPGTTRYSATFDRPYEEEERSNSATANGSRRSRSQSWQASVGMDIRPYTPLGPSHRSSSSDSGASKGAEQIPTRTVSKTPVKTHNNPFQFVKVGTCPLYKKAEQQLKKVQEVKKPEVLKEEEEEWQTNLDSWKSRRRKMSEDIFRRQDEIRQFEMEEQSTQAVSKKTKTFSEMVESRAHRGRTMSLCLLSSPLELQQWELENGKNNSSRPFSEGSEENSAVNSEDEGGSEKRMFQKNLNSSSNCTNGNGTHNLKNGSTKNKGNKLFELGENCSLHKDGIYIDSGLESISSSHRTGDTPDSCSDFSQDSGSSIDCDSPRVSGLILHGVNLLEDFNQNSLHHSDSSDSFSNTKANCTDTSPQSNREEALKSSVSNGERNCLLQDTSPKTNGCTSKKETLNKEPISRKLENSIGSCTSQSSINDELQHSSEVRNKQERSVESENEVFVDDFEELNSKVFLSSNLESKDATASASSEALKTEASDFSSSTLISPTNLQQSVTCGPSAADTVAKPPSLSQNDNLEPKKQKKSQKLEGQALTFNEVKTPEKLEVNSQVKGTNPALNPKDTKKKPNRKRATAKVLSVETSNQNETSVKKLDRDDKSLNIVFQSETSNKDSLSNSTCDTKAVSSSNNGKVPLRDVLPVEKIAEEMEKLILQQLEEEERAKEMSSKTQTLDAFESPEHNLIAPSRVAVPPKEKPPPPPSAENEVQKTPSLKRINSTKRIKKEIHKRRSNFLGIENADEILACDESLVPPPPALEQILKAEMESDRESRKKLESASNQRLKLQEKEIIEKEREIIATLETEERQKHLVKNEELCNNVQEEDRIQKLKEERKRKENERILADTQRLRLAEEKQLKEREEYIRKQEEHSPSLVELSSSVLSDAANLSNIPKSPNASSLCSETKPNVSLSDIGGEGETVTKSSSQILDHSTSEIVEKPSIPAKPVVPPKPLKKKEAIRKERERLRQEQETLQKEREEHRQKLIKEQELLKNHQNSNAPVSKLGPVPPLKPSYTPKLTNSICAQPSARENVIFTSQSYHEAQNGISSSCVDPVCSVVSKQQKQVPSHKKVVQPDARMQQKVSLVKKQTHEAVAEGKYNQNHWLIQEAEMRRIAELKERQHSAQYPVSQTYLAEDDVCSTKPRAPVVSPVNALKQDKRVYGLSNMAVKKCPPPMCSDKPTGVYARNSAIQPPTKPSRIVPMERPEQMLSVSGRKRCSHCNEELGRGAAMIIESLQLYYHIQCFQCCVCQAQLGNGSCGTDVRVRNNKLHCHNCYSNDEAGLKFSQV